MKAWAREGLGAAREGLGAGGKEQRRGKETVGEEREVRERNLK
jgi:hypothetical protein